MDFYTNLQFYYFHENYFINKIVFYDKVKNLASLSISTLFQSILVNSYIIWLNIFKFSIKSRKITKFSLSINNYRIFNKTILKKKLNLFVFLRKNFLVFFFFNNLNKTPLYLFLNFYKSVILFSWKLIYKSLLDIYKKTFGESFYYVRGLFLIFLIDASITDDEPLWEPIEWSLIQTWLLFIFFFAWIAENLITSRYGSYTGRDKRVWFAWYKTFWLVELCYITSYGLAAVFVIVPFYYELTYSVSFIFSWWNWYTRVFFFKFISIYSIIILISYIFQINIRWSNWKKSFILILIINFFLIYLLYTHFIMSFFGYFTDPVWYQKTRFIDYIQLSHEPLKWGWGPSKRDHFSYHKVSTVFWFKNDGPFAGAFLMFHFFFFLSIFFLYMYWLVLLRKVYTTREVTYTFSTFCNSSLKQFYYFFLLLYVFIFMSFIVCYWRFPIEFLWIVNVNSWFINFINICLDYYTLFLDFLK